MEFPRKFFSKNPLAWYADIPFYYGKEDKYGYADWESYIEEFFAYYALSEEEMYCCAKWRLLGEASRWWKNYGEGCEFWYQMKAEFQHRYLPKRRTVVLKQQVVTLKPEVQCQLAPKLEHEPEPDIEPEPAVALEFEFLTGPERETEIEFNHEPDVDTHRKHGADSEIEPEPEVEICIKSEPYIEPEPCTEPEPDVEICVESEPEMTHEPECYLEPPIEPDAAVQLDFKSEPVTAPATESHSEFSLHIPLQLVEHIDFVISEPPPLTNQQLLCVCLSFLEPPYFHEDARIRIHISSHFKIRGRVFSNTKTFQIHVSFLFTIHQEVNLSKPRRMIGDPK